MTVVTVSVDGKLLYSFPESMTTIKSVSVGGRPLAHGITTIDGEKFIVLLEPVEVSGAEIKVEGR